MEQRSNSRNFSFMKASYVNMFAPYRPCKVCKPDGGPVVLRILYAFSLSLPQHDWPSPILKNRSVVYMYMTSITNGNNKAPTVLTFNCVYVHACPYTYRTSSQLPEYIGTPSYVYIVHIHDPIYCSIALGAIVLSSCGSDVTLARKRRSEQQKRSRDEEAR